MGCLRSTVGCAAWMQLRPRRETPPAIKTAVSEAQQCCLKDQPSSDLHKDLSEALECPPSPPSATLESFDPAGPASDTDAESHTTSSAATAGMRPTTLRSESRESLDSAGSGTSHRDGLRHTTSSAAKASMHPRTFTLGSCESLDSAGSGTSDRDGLRHTTSSAATASLRPRASRSGSWTLPVLLLLPPLLLFILLLMVSELHDQLPLLALVWAVWAFAIRTMIHCTAEEAKAARRQQVARTGSRLSSMDSSKDAMEMLRCRLLPDGEDMRLNMEAPAHQETPLSTIKAFGMLRARQEDRSGSLHQGHFTGRKRLWEMRLQIEFQVPPEDLWVGVELEGKSRMSSMAQAGFAMLKLIIFSYFGRGIYHSAGDAKSSSREEKEAEPPTFAVPLWGFDQVIVSDVGQEPDLMGDLTGLGYYRRRHGLKAYQRELSGASRGIGRGTVLTLCFWGPSRYFDLVNWWVRCLPRGAGFSMTELVGGLPFIVTLYDLGGVEAEGNDKRHLRSRKRHFFRAAVWHDS
mmetsp:Transcript_66662/g.145332  ORF Transcript_66662/g.145332 Transcript_66662/m.145332 type:complete len:519 (-) Transcript_66662:292-1848(-)